MSPHWKRINKAIRNNYKRKHKNRRTQTINITTAIQKSNFPPLHHQRWREQPSTTTPYRTTEYDPRTDGDIISVLTRIKRGGDVFCEVKKYKRLTAISRKKSIERDKQRQKNDDITKFTERHLRKKN